MTPPPLLDLVISLFVYTMGSFGLAYVVGFSKITGAIREWLGKHGLLGRWTKALVECPACFGFWTGVGAVLFKFDPLELSLGTQNVIAFGLYTCGANLFLSLWSGLIYGGVSG